MASIVDRIKEFIDFSGLTIASFERAISMSNGAFGKSLKTGGSIGSDKIEKIFETFPDLNPSWLITGHGRMLLSDYADKVREPLSPEVLAKIPVAHQTDKPGEGIPLIPVEAMAGALTSEQTVLQYDCERYVVPVFKDADFLIQVKGSSMFPHYASGDIVACRRVPLGDLFFQWGKVYVIDTNQGALIKRIKPSKHDHNILMVSDNPEYDPFELSRESINGIALVIGVIRLE